MAKRVAHYKTVPIEDLKKIVADSYSYSEVLRRLGYLAIAGNHKGIVLYLASLEIDTRHFGQNGRQFQQQQNRNVNYLFCKDSTYSRTSLKKIIIKRALIPHQCAVCLLEPIWQGTKLVLVLDHINGTNNDNRIENLRFLCPNCNSQTSTFSSKNYTYKNLRKIEIKSGIAGDFPEELTAERIISVLKSQKNIKNSANALKVSISNLYKKAVKLGIDTEYYLKREYLFEEIQSHCTKGVSSQELSHLYNTEESVMKKMISRFKKSIELPIKTEEKSPSLKKTNKLLRPRLKDVDAEKILEALIKHRKMSLAAKELGFSDSAIKKRLTQLGIDYKRHLEGYQFEIVYENYIKTKSIFATSIELGISNKTVKKILVEHGIELFNKPSVISPEIRIQAEEMIRGRVSCCKISKHLNISEKTVKKYKYLLGLVKNNNGKG